MTGAREKVGGSEEKAVGHQPWAAQNGLERPGNMMNAGNGRRHCRAVEMGMSCATGEEVNGWMNQLGAYAGVLHASETVCISIYFLGSNNH